ncbi:MAG: hypothetical protein HC828_17635 [Blastochloris sp.]|nr:hypothetical protein [Blastochloris sp.]
MASRLTKSVLPIVRILRADMRPGVPITLWIDLNGAEMPKKQVNRVDHGDAKNTIDTFYIHRWLVGKARLADRSQVQWQITDYLRNRSTTFRRTGGRVKTKVKPKTKMVINLWLNVPMRLYPNVTATPTQTSDNKLHLKEKPRYISIRLKQKYRYAQPGISVHLFRQTIGQAYRQITPPQQSVSYTGATRVL